MSNLSILNNSIRTFENLYSLNDLHIASGAEKKYQPALFFRLDQTKELIQEIESENSDLQICRSVKSLRNGINKGTWACEELVIAYAAWISAAFHLKVLRAFLALHKGERLTQPQQLALPEPDRTFILTLTEDELKTLAWTWKAATYMSGITGMIYQPLRQLGSSYAPACCSCSIEYKHTLDSAAKILRKATSDIKIDKLNRNGWNNVLPELRKGQVNSLN